MSVRARRRGREEAFKLLFQADQGVVAFDDILVRERVESGAPPAAWEFAELLTQGTWQRLAEIDAWLERLAQGWTVERMAAADRAILRLATFELVGGTDTPVSVAINEAVELAKKYGTDESPRFINGILGAVAREAPGERVDSGEQK